MLSSKRGRVRRRPPCQEGRQQSTDDTSITDDIHLAFILKVQLPRLCEARALLGCSFDALRAAESLLHAIATRAGSSRRLGLHCATTGTSELQRAIGRCKPCRFGPVADVSSPRVVVCSASPPEVKSRGYLVVVFGFSEFLLRGLRPEIYV
jgi:hypothetical protein